MSMAPLPAYSKPWLPVADQLAILENRGLVIDDRNDAESFLGHVNYYRFAGYCLAFEDARHSFRTGVTFEQVKHACQFDASLRDLFTEALELIEIDLRTATALHFGKTYGAFGHTDAANFHPRFDDNVTHAEWLAKLHEETRRSKELFVAHFRNTYDGFPNLPIWTVTEIMSFGGLSKMIGGLRKRDRQVLAAQYKVSARVLSSLTHHLVYVRNLCAHHCRLWDRVWSLKADLPTDANWMGINLVPNDRLFSTLMLMRQLQLRSPQIRSEATAWKRRVDGLLKSPPAVPDPYMLMGTTSRWESHPAWQ